MKDVIVAIIVAFGGSLGGSGVLAQLILRNSSKNSLELEKQFKKVNTRIDQIEENQIGQSRVVKKNLILSLLLEWDKASDEVKPWIADKINYEFENYREPPINGNSWVEEALKLRSLI